MVTSGKSIFIFFFPNKIGLRKLKKISRVGRAYYFSLVVLCVVSRLEYLKSMSFI